MTPQHGDNAAAARTIAFLERKLKRLETTARELAERITAYGPACPSTVRNLGRDLTKALDEKLIILPEEAAVSWYTFFDLHSGGHAKTPYEVIRVEAETEDAAVARFQTVFPDVDPRASACDCCGKDFSIMRHEDRSTAESMYETWSEGQRLSLDATGLATIKTGKHR